MIPKYQLHSLYVLILLFCSYWSYIFYNTAQILLFTLIYNLSCFQFFLSVFLYVCTYVHMCTGINTYVIIKARE